MLSAMENGQRAREQGRENAFSDLVDFDTALNFMRTYVAISDAWLNCQQTLAVRYESLLTDYETQAIRLAQFLNLDPLQAPYTQVIEHYRPESASSDQKGLHFSHGKIGRFRRKMSPEQQAILSEVFGDYLDRLGYER